MTNFETERFLHESIDHMVEHLAERMEAAAIGYGIEEFEISALEKSYVKEVCKTLVPSKSPTTSFMVIQILKACLEWNHDVSLIKLAQEDPDKLEELKQQLVDSEAGQKLLNTLEEQQEKMAAQYKEVEVNNAKLKVADLGDVVDTSTVSYN